VSPRREPKKEIQGHRDASPYVRGREEEEAAAAEQEEAKEEAKQEGHNQLVQYE
jgi:hypothetical protein